MTLDTTSYQSAIAQLEKALAYAHSDVAAHDPGLQEQLRNSVIHCFEFTYELSHKILKRHLTQTVATPEDIEQSSFAEWVRTGCERGLLRSDWTRWRIYRQARTDSSHTYDPQKATAVWAIAPDLLEEAKHLLTRIAQAQAQQDA